MVVLGAALAADAAEGILGRHGDPPIRDLGLDDLISSGPVSDYDVVRFGLLVGGARVPAASMAALDRIEARSKT